MVRVLITGITGFSGSHLAEHLLDEYDIYGTIRGRCRQTDFINHIKDNLTLLECDLSDYNSVIATIDDSKPDLIFHLAAQSFVPTSWRAPQETMTTNVLGTLNLLEAVRKSQYDPRILITGSSEEYGLVYPEETPVKESNIFRPLSPYGVSKVAQDLMGYQYYKSYGMKIVRTRAFNLMGPRSGEKIFTAAFSKQIAKIEKGIMNPILYTGNLSAVRDLNDVRDIVSAYTIAINKCNVGEVYNICNGVGHSVNSILDRLLNLTDRDIEIKVIDSMLRPSDVELLIGDSSKFKNKTGWCSKYSLEQSLEDILNYWRNNI